MSSPASPFARVVGRVVRPDGTAAAGRLTLTPDAQHPNATLPGGEVVVVPSTVVDLDGEGRVASTVDGVPAPWVENNAVPERLALVPVVGEDNVGPEEQVNRRGLDGSAPPTIDSSARVEDDQK